ncbi:MAG: S53 family peptidase [Bacteroidota bacterium]
MNFPATPIGHPDPQQVLDLSIYLRPQQTNPQVQQKLSALIYQAPHERTYLNRKELAANFGASTEDMNALTQYFEGCSIKVVKKDDLAKMIALKGSVSNFEKAFNITLSVFQGPNQMTYLAYQGSLYLPAILQPMVTRVTGLVEPMKTEYRLPTRNTQAEADGATAAIGGYSPTEVAQAYNFPEKLTGKGQCIGIIELGGKAKESDFKAFFKKNGIKEPKIVTVGQPLSTKVNLLNNTEVTMDVQVAGAIAPNATLVIYYANTIVDAMKLVISDDKNKPTVVSCSWAGPESNYNSMQVAEMSQLFYEAALLGITVIAASGDHGAYFSSKTPNVALPSSHPYVIGSGGTIIDINDGKISSEVVWNEYGGQVASGGGFSSLFQQPYYQRAAVAAYPYQKGSTRGVPDVAADAGMKSGYQVIFNGKEEVIGGTSASTPVWAALIALLNEGLGYNLGFANAMLYEFAGRGFRQIVSGNNNYYQAAKYWNPCTGLGSPDGQALLDLFHDYAQQSSSKK